MSIFPARSGSNGVANLRLVDLPDGSKAVAHVVLDAGGNPMVPAADASISSLAAAVQAAVSAMRAFVLARALTLVDAFSGSVASGASVVIPSNLGADFDVAGAQTAGKISIVAASTAAFGKVRFATAAEALARAPGVVMDVAHLGATFADLTTAQTIGGAKTFSTSPQVPSPAAADSSASAAPTSWVHALTAPLAPLASPSFTGTVRVPTPAAGDASGAAANTQWVTNALAGVAAGIHTTATAPFATAAALPSYTYSNGTITATANGALSIDGGSPTSGLVLVKNETGANQPYNGLYVVTNPGSGSAPFVLTRDASMASASQFSGALVPIGPGGATNAGSFWLCNPTGSITVGTTAIPFTQFNTPASVTPGPGIVVQGNQVSIPGYGSVAVGSLLKITSGGLAQAVAGTDYLSPTGASQTFADLTSAQTISGKKTFGGGLASTNFLLTPGSGGTAALLTWQTSGVSIGSFGGAITTLQNGASAIAFQGLNGYGVAVNAGAGWDFTIPLKAPTMTTADSSTNVATTAFVNALLSNSALLGAVLSSLPTTPPTIANQAWRDPTTGAVCVS